MGSPVSASYWIGSGGYCWLDFPRYLLEQLNMFNSTQTTGQAKRIAYNPGFGFKLHVKQATTVAYRRATNGQKPKNVREEVRVMS